MSKDIFSADVKPSGLKDKDEIKILICYLLTSIKSGLKKEDILKSIEENSIANYFDIADCLSDLLSKGNVNFSKEQNLYMANNETEMISQRLDTFLPYSVREQALNTALRLLKKLQHKNENSVDIEKNNNGFDVTCRISGGEVDLAQIKLYVPDMLQAKKVEDNFYNNPDLLYKCIISILTEDKELALDSIKEFSDDTNS